MLLNSTNFVVFSSGIKKIPNLPLFIAEDDSDNTQVLGWGFKPTARRARNYAAKHQLPYIALEDGFLRSVGLGVSGVPPLSLVVDEVGIYYDAHQPSKLEQLIAASEALSNEQLARSQRCIDAFRQYRLSKYNQLTCEPKLTKALPKVVVLDQTLGDASVSGALADKTSFVEMLKQALDAHPEEAIWVKVHPDVVAGKKRGFLYPLPFEHPRLKLYSQSVNPWAFLDSAEHVYTVSSLMGFEALLAGCTVHCFGLPFYAGWGLTHDHLDCERRNQPRNLRQVFHAAYIGYARYVDPILGERCELENVMNYCIDESRRLSRPKIAVQYQSITMWKRCWLKDFLKAWHFDLRRRTNATPLAWGRKGLAEGTICVEDGFLRSVGLGVHFQRPISLVRDGSGIYFDATKPSDLELALNGASHSSWQLQRARRLIQKLNAAHLTKYNVGDDTTLSLPDNVTIILVPGQVEGDASIEFGSPEVKSNAELLRRVRLNHPDAYIVYKPHPDVLAGQRDDGQWQGEFLQYADCVVQQTSMSSLLYCVDEVHTMTSLAGFEALLRGKKVVTYGLPFYAGWGLTHDKVKCPRRTNRLSLESLVYEALIAYPTYVDPLTRQPCTVEQAVSRLALLKNGGQQISDKKLQLLLALKRTKRWVKRNLLGR